MTTTARPEHTRPLTMTVGMALQPRIARSGALTPAVAAGALSVAVVVVARSVWGSDHAVERALHVAVMLLAGSIGSALDDPTEVTVASAPTSLRIRRTFRLLPAATAAGLGWAVSVVVAGVDAAGSHTLMLAGLAATATAVAALAARRRPQRAGVASVGVVLAAALIVTRVPDRWSMLPDPATGFDQPAMSRWAAIIVIGFAIFVYASRDPGRAHIRDRCAHIEPSHPRNARRL